MSEIQITQSGIKLRFGGLDTPIPEGAVNATPLPRIVVALSPVDPRMKVSVLATVNGSERSVNLRAGRRTREEQFFEGSFPEVRGGDRVEYYVRVDLETGGEKARLDSSAFAGGIRQFEIVEARARRREIVALSGDVTSTGFTNPLSHSLGPSIRESAVSGELPHASAASTGGEGTSVTNRVLPGDGAVGIRAPGSGAVANQGGRVSGVIALEHGLPAQKIKVRLYQRGFGGNKTLLREVETDDAGNYEIPYSVTGVANIEVFTVDTAGTEVQLSHTKFGAAADEKMDLIAPSTVQPAAAEFTRLKSAVTPHVGGKFELLKDALQRYESSDFSYLSGTTKWDAVALALASGALSLEAHTKIPAEGLYAMARVGVPTDARTLANVSKRSVSLALRRAADAGIIEATAVEKSEKAFAEFSTEFRFSKPIQGALSSPKDFVAKARVSEADRAVFAKLVRDEDPKDLWEKAKSSGVSEAGIQKLQLQGKLAYLTFNNVDLTAYLERKITADPLELIGLGFFDEDKWKSALKELSGGDDAKCAAFIPAVFTGRTVEERLDVYAGELARRVRQMDPHAVTVERIVAGKIEGIPDRENVGKFLRNATAQGFRLGKTPLSSFIKSKEATIWNGVPSDKKNIVIENMRTLSSLYAVSPSDETMSALMAAGFKSSTGIASYDFNTFENYLTPFLLPRAKAGDKETISRIFWKAQQQSATVFNVFDGLKRLNSTPFAPGSTPDDVQKRNDQIVRTREKLSGLFPTLETLFGTVDYCECEHCQSVLSPAAYLVDLLRFMDPNEEAWASMKGSYKVRIGAEYLKRKPFDVLNDRRPDIKNIALTCENTNVALPHIDIVNEILEQVMMSDQTPPVIEAYDVGEVSSQDLIAEPQNILWSAYVGSPGKQGLRDLVYPIGLPFDLPLEMVRAFLKQLGLPLWRLRECLVKRTSLLPSAAGRADGWTDVWFERLGLTPGDISALTTSDKWYTLYGYASSEEALKMETIGGISQPAEASLRNGKTLARRLNITYKELIEIIRTRFINPEIESLITLHRLGVDPDIVDRYFGEGEPLSNSVKTEFEAGLKAHKIKPEELRALRSEAVRKITLVLHSPSVGCDFSETTIAFDQEPRDVEPSMAMILLKMNLLVRLQKKFGWEIHELDRLLMVSVPNASALTMATWAESIRTSLIYLAHIEELRETFKDRLSREEISILWSEIPTQGIDCLYDRLFLNPAALLRDNAFEKRLGVVLQGSASLKDHLDGVRQAFQLSHEEIEAILDAVKPPDRSLSITNLSILMRYAMLARGLELSIDDLIVLLDLSERKPLSALDGGPLVDISKDVPWTETIQFVREVGLLRDAEVDAEFINRVCRQVGGGEVPASNKDPVALALSALPPGDLETPEKVQSRIVQTLAAQLKATEATVDRLLSEVLKDATGKALKKVGFTAASRKESLSQLRIALKMKEPAANETDPVLASLSSLSAELELPEKTQTLIVQTLAAQLSAPEALIDYLLDVALTDATGIPLKRKGFFDPTSTAESLRRLQKSLDVVQKLNISDGELAYLTHDPRPLKLNDLPATPVTDRKIAQKLMTGLSGWFKLVAARKQFGRSERMLAVLSAAKQPIDAVNSLAAREKALHDALAALTGRKQDWIAEALNALGAKSTGGTRFEVPALVDPENVLRTLDSLKCLIRLGMSPADVVQLAGAPIDDVVARKVRSSLKGRYRPAAWRRLVKPIFDSLRKKQRDALVGYLTHVMEGDRPKYGDTIEKLFEFLLLDPGMEPVVVASRIQLAISSVQLFVQRCLMNLENNPAAENEGVDPRIIDVKRWEWMQRYRVWEVNRKMFIWTENWLDPEFRDDKTHIFRDLESKLLEGDVNDDLVRTALHTYLRGLEEIARLEMLTMYFEPGISADGAVIHVVGRTQSAPYKYFYRRVAHGMWTPWEPIDVGIEGAHLVLTSWRGRMHLFWVSFLEEATESSNVPKKMKPGTDEVSLDQFRGGTKVKLQLHWVEQLDGKWVNRSSTPGFVDTEFDDFKATTDEDKAAYFVRAVAVANSPGVEDDDLEIHITAERKDANQSKSHKFLFFSKLAPPRSITGGGTSPLPPPFIEGASETELQSRKTKWKGSGGLKAKFISTVQQNSLASKPAYGDNKHQVLGSGTAYTLLFPSNDRLPVPARTPPSGVGRPTGFIFRLQDAQHVVYRLSDGGIHDLFWTRNGWFQQSPSVDADNADPADDPEPAIGDPHGYAVDDRGMMVIAYCGATKVHELVWSQLDPSMNDPQSLATGWQFETLYQAPNSSEQPIGRPFGGIFTPQRGVVFRTKDGKVLASIEGSTSAPWEVKELNAGFSRAVSDPTGLLMTKTELGITSVLSRHVFYVGSDGDVHELRSDKRGESWKHFNITQSIPSAVKPAANANPAAYAFLGQNTLHVVYRGSDDRIHELWGNPGSWNYNPIGANFTKAKGDPCGYVTESLSAQHVVYRGEQDQVVELWWSDSWLENVLTSGISAAPSASSDVGAYSFENLGTHHVVYFNQDGNPQELWWSSDGWHHGTYALQNPFPDSLGPLASPFFYEALERDHTFFVEPFVVETAVHEWTEWIVTTREYFEPDLVNIPLIPLNPNIIQVIPNAGSILKIPPRVTKTLFDDRVVVRTPKGIFGSGIDTARGVIESARISVATPFRTVDVRRGAQADVKSVATSRARGGIQ